MKRYLVGFAAAIMAGALASPISAMPVGKSVPAAETAVVEQVRDGYGKHRHYRKHGHRHYGRSYGRYYGNRYYDRGPSFRFGYGDRYRGHRYGHNRGGFGIWIR
jgi:hypothetical protein